MNNRKILRELKKLKYSLHLLKSVSFETFRVDHFEIHGKQLARRVDGAVDWWWRIAVLCLSVVREDRSEISSVDTLVRIHIGRDE